MPKTKTKSKEKSKTVVKVKPNKDDRVNARRLLDTVEQSWYEFAQVISVIYHSEEYLNWKSPLTKKEYEKFSDYVKDELGLEYRMAMFRVQVGDALKQFKITKGMIENLGWTKFKELSGILNSKMSEAELKRLFKKSQGMTFAEIKDYVKSEKIKRDIVSRTTTHVFKLTNDQNDVVEEALKEAKVLAQSDNPSVALEYIATEWLINHDPKKAEKIMKKVHVPEVVEKAPHKKHAHAGKKQAGKKKAVKKKAAKKKKVAKKKVAKKKAKR